MKIPAFLAFAWLTAPAAAQAPSAADQLGGSALTESFQAFAQERAAEAENEWLFSFDPKTTPRYVEEAVAKAKTSGKLGDDKYALRENIVKLENQIERSHDQSGTTCQSVVDSAAAGYKSYQEWAKEDLGEVHEAQLELLTAIQGRLKDVKAKEESYSLYDRLQRDQTFLAQTRERLNRISGAADSFSSVENHVRANNLWVIKKAFAEAFALSSDKLAAAYRRHGLTFDPRHTRQSSDDILTIEFDESEPFFEACLPLLSSRPQPDDKEGKEHVYYEPCSFIGAFSGHIEGADIASALWSHRKHYHITSEVLRLSEGAYVTSQPVAKACIDLAASREALAALRSATSAAR